MYFRQCQSGKYFHPTSLTQCLAMLMGRKLLQLRDINPFLFANAPYGDRGGTMPWSIKGPSVGRSRSNINSSCYTVYHPVSYCRILGRSPWMASVVLCRIGVLKNSPHGPMGAMRVAAGNFLLIHSSYHVWVSEHNAPLYYYHSQCYPAAATACPFVIAGMSFVLLCFRRSFLVPVEDFTSALKLSVLATFSNPSR